ncbi:MAG: DUF6879 family protein [Pseudonocardia sp.]
MRLEADAWRSFFDAYKREAFRLESLPSYGVASEDEELQGFLSGGELVIPDDDPWLRRVRHFRATGRWIGRVHVLRQPLSDYLRYEFAVYAHTVRAGEDVRILDLAAHHDLDLPAQDFWLFDDRHVVRMDYDGDGVQMGRELLEQVDPAPYVARKQQALELAMPFLEYQAKLIK